MDSLVSLIKGTGSIRTIMDNPSLTLLTRIGYDGTAKSILLAEILCSHWKMTCYETRRI